MAHPNDSSPRAPAPRPHSPNMRSIAFAALLCCAPCALAAQLWNSPPPGRPSLQAPSQQAPSPQPPSPQAPSSQAPSSQAPSPQAPAPGPRVQGTGDYLTRMDADDNGQVSLAEYQDWLSYAFDRMDRNRDGVLSVDEQPGGRGKTLTRDEHRTRVAETFKRQDRNRDGVLDTRELAAPPQAK